jgi:hypothetical protein
MSSQGTGIAFDPARSDRRQVHIKDKNGDLVGSNYRIPKGDFAHVLGLRAPTEREDSGKEYVSPDRVLEMALHKEFNKLGEGATARGNVYRNMYVSSYPYEQKPGQEHMVVKEQMDSIQKSVEMNGASNMWYLEMQYKFLMASKNFSTISNLMKVRSDTTKKAISEVR